MKNTPKRLPFIVTLGFCICLMACVCCMVLIMFASPYTRPSNKAMKVMCMHRIESYLSITDQLDSVQEAADILRHLSDPWGHNFNVIVADKFARESFVQVTGDLIMWSSGPNGVNENGQGDDVMIKSRSLSPDCHGNTSDTCK